MMPDTHWNEEWNVLREERERARARWRRAAAGLAARAADPFGIGRLVHRQPVAATGIGAAVVAVPVKLLLGATRTAPDDGAEHDAATRPRAAWRNALHDVATGVGVPWLARFVREVLEAAPQPTTTPGAARPATAVPQPAARDTAAVL